MKPWFKTLKASVLLALSIALLLLVACGPSATATPVPATSQAPTSTTAPGAPTAAPQATQPPGAGLTGSPKVAPSFSEYWNPPTGFYGEPVYGGTLRVNYEDPLEHANVWGAFTGATVRLRGVTHNRILAESPYDPNRLVPNLARGWTTEPDATGVTFFFHDGITWHNGETFTCEDARFTIQTWLTSEGITASAMKATLGFVDLDTTECLDDNTLKVGFTGANAAALLAFTTRGAVIFNKAWFEAGGEEAMFQDLSVGTGPYVWDSGQTVGIDEQHFVRNENYFKGDGALPYLDEVVIFGILDESAQQAAMLAHQTDWHWVRNFGQYDAYVKHDQINTVIRATRGHHTLWLNRNNPPFDNVRVRQAIIMGMDRAAGIAVLQEGFGSPGFMMVPGSAWELDRSLGCAVPGWCIADDMDAQRAEAKGILEEEGFDFDKTYLFTVESDAQVVARATFMQEQLRLLGVKTDFDLVETVAYRQQTSTGTWGDFLPRNDTMPADDPFLGMGHYFNSASVTNNHWCPCENRDDIQIKMDDLLTQAGVTVDPVQRKAISDEAQLFAMEQYWKFPIYWEQEAVSFWPEVRGYFHHPQPSGSHTNFEQMWIDPSHKDDKGFSGQTTGVPGGIN